MNRSENVEIVGVRRAYRGCWVIVVAAVSFAIVAAGACAADDRVAADSESPALPPKSNATARTTASPNSLTRSAATLAGVVGAVVLVVALVRRFVPGLTANAAARMMHVLGSSPLGNRATVFIVRCGPRVLILGVTAGQVTTLAEIADPDEIEEFTRLAQPAAARKSDGTSEKPAAAPSAVASLKGQLDGLLNKVESWKA